MQRGIVIRRRFCGGIQRAVRRKRHRKRHHGKIAVVLRGGLQKGIFRKPDVVLKRFPVRTQIDPRADLADRTAVDGDRFAIFVAFDDRAFAELFGVERRRVLLRRAAFRERRRQQGCRQKKDQE